MSCIIKIIKYFSLSFFCLFSYLSILSAEEPRHKVIVIVPLEHEAMTQIVSGIEESLAGTNSEIIVQNAHGDPNIMLSIIKQIKNQNPDVIIPIGTSTSQMAISHIHNKPIVCAAADKANLAANEFVTGVNDEIPITASISQLHKLRNIAVIYSASEKVFSEIEALKNYGMKNNLKIHLAMIQTLLDLPTTVRALPKDIEAFVILKDHLVVSGINILMQEANKRAIPLVVSDEGSVIKGATLAIGVKEKSIGNVAGEMAKEILLGKKPREIAYKVMDQLTIFVNSGSFDKQHILNKEDIAHLSMPQIIVE